jgi:hypothetical protein
MSRHRSFRTRKAESHLFPCPPPLLLRMHHDRLLACLERWWTNTTSSTRLPSSRSASNVAAGKRKDPVLPESHQFLSVRARVPFRFRLVIETATVFPESHQFLSDAGALVGYWLVDLALS